MKTEKRTDYLDIAKGFAIIAVVLWHIDFNILDSDIFPIKTFFAGGQWHVPVFFLLAGFFIKDEKLSHPFVFIKSKLKSIHLLTLYFYVPAVFLHNVFFQLGFYSTNVNYGGKFIITYVSYPFLGLV